jgi:hypothetical protein
VPKDLVVEKKTSGHVQSKGQTYLILLTKIWSIETNMFGFRKFGVTGHVQARGQTYRVLVSGVQ